MAQAFFIFHLSNQNLLLEYINLLQYHDININLFMNSTNSNLKEKKQSQYLSKPAHKYLQTVPSLFQKNNGVKKISQELEADSQFIKNAKLHFKQIRRKFKEYVSRTDQLQTADLPNFIEPRQIIKSINQVRANPKQMASYIRAQAAKFTDNKVKRCGVTVLYNEGQKAFIQAAKFLESSQPLPPLQFNECLSLAASDLVIDLIGTNSNSFEGSDNSTPRDRISRRAGRKINQGTWECLDNRKYYDGPDFVKQMIVHLIVDDGSESRGRRKFLFSDKYPYMGAAMIKNPGSGYKCYLQQTTQNIQIGIPQQVPFQPIYKTTNQSFKEISDSMIEQKKYVKQVRAKFIKHVSSIVQSKQVQELQNQIDKKEIVHWLNIARTKPLQFADLIRQQLKEFVDQFNYRRSGVLFKSHEGKKVYLQAIQFLQKQTPLRALSLNQCLNLAAADHVMDMIMNSFFGHASSDGSSVSQRVKRRCSNKLERGRLCQNLDILSAIGKTNFALETIIRFIVDDGVPTRGHRSNLFDQEVQFVGICMIKDPSHGYKNALDFSSADLPCLNKEGGAGMIQYGNIQKKIQMIINTKKVQREAQKQEISFKPTLTPKISSSGIKQQYKLSGANKFQTINTSSKVGLKTQDFQQKKQQDKLNKSIAGLNLSLDKSTSNIFKTPLLTDKKNQRVNTTVSTNNLQALNRLKSILNPESQKKNKFSQITSKQTTNKALPNANDDKKAIKKQTTVKNIVIQKGISKIRVVKTTQYLDGRIEKKVSFI